MTKVEHQPEQMVSQELLGSIDSRIRAYLSSGSNYSQDFAGLSSEVQNFIIEAVKKLLKIRVITESEVFGAAERIVRENVKISGDVPKGDHKKAVAA